MNILSMFKSMTAAAASEWLAARSPPIFFHSINNLGDEKKQARVGAALWPTSAWRPFSEAPKDGRPFVVLDPRRPAGNTAYGHGYEIGFWVQPKSKKALWSGWHIGGFRVDSESADYVDGLVWHTLPERPPIAPDAGERK